VEGSVSLEYIHSVEFISWCRRGLRIAAEVSSKRNQYPFILSRSYAYALGGYGTSREKVPIYYEENVEQFWTIEEEWFFTAFEEWFDNQTEEERE